MDWIEFEASVKDLAKQIDYRPTIISAVVRGGLIPARLLSSYLNVKRILCITVEKSSAGSRSVVDIPGNLTGEKILLVEDMLETRASLQSAFEYLQSKGALVKTCALFTLPETSFKPDYYLKKLPKPAKFPWE